MSTIFAGNTTTTSLVQTGDISGNLVLSSIGNIVLSPGTGYGVVWANNAAFSSGGSGGLTMAAVQTANITAVASTIYPVDTTSANITATLPASPAAGAQIQFVDYAGTFGTYSLKIYPAGLKIQGNTSNVTLSTNRSSAALMYIDATQGWVAYNGFTNSPVGTYSAQALIVAGGGGTNSAISGGGGAGGLIYVSSTTLTPGTAYSIVVGSGGAASASGSNSSGLGQTALGGGQGGPGYSGNGFSGGSGGGGSRNAGTGGAGTAGQGNTGGNGSGTGGTDNLGSGGGGGGAGANGGAASGGTAGNGGVGSSYTISGSAVYYAGGGGGGAYNGTGGTGGTGGGGPGTGNNTTATNGTANTGGGGGASGYNAGGAPATSGGSGIVIISYLGGQRGSGGAYTSSGGYSIHTFTSSGTYIA